MHLVHGNHLSYSELKDELPELNLTLLEDNMKLKNLVDSVFYSYDIFLVNPQPIVKIIEGDHMIGRVKLSHQVMNK